MPKFECKKCGSLVIVEQSAKTAMCKVCGKKQAVPAVLIDDNMPTTMNNYDPQWDHYEKLVTKARRYRDIRILTETAEEFDRLGEYENSQDMAEFCRKRIAEEQIKRQEEAKTREINDQRKSKGRKMSHIKAWILNITVVLVLVVPTLIWNAIISPNQDYNRAEAMMAAGRYEDAIYIFEDLDGFKDSNDRIAECEAGIIEEKYNETVESMNNGYYASAAQSFTDLNGYKDSASLALFCKYQNAVNLMNDENYERALNIFTALGDYEDSRAHAAVCDAAAKEEKYLYALRLMESESYTTAKGYLLELDGYKDSAELANECIYQNALYLIQTEKYKWALKELEKIPNYRDAQELIKEIEPKISSTE